MDQIELLQLMYNEGFVKIIDKLDDLLNNEQNLINLIILNLDNNDNNINLLCNYIKTNINKYNSLLNTILQSTIDMSKKKYLLLKIFNNNFISNLDFYTVNIYNIIISDLEDININSLENNLVYTIFNNNIYDNTDFSESINNYITIFNTLTDLSEIKFLKWLYKLTNIYNYRCKSYTENNFSDNILYTLLYCLIIKYEILKYDISFFTNTIDITNILFDDISSISNNDIKIHYNILILKFIIITIYHNIEDKYYYNNIIIKHKDVINKLENGNTILDTFTIIKDWLIKNNKKNILKYENKNTNIMYRLHNDLMYNVYYYYIDLIKNLNNNIENLKNTEYFSNLIYNIIDFYIFYNLNKNYNKFIYDNTDDKYICINFINKIFNSNISNINLNIKIVDLYCDIFKYEYNSFLITCNKSNQLELLNKFIIFYIELNKYDDYYINNTKYKIIYLFNNIFDKPFKYLNIIQHYFDDNTNSISKFLINLNDDLYNFIDNFLYYFSSEFINTNNNSDETIMTYKYHIYCQELIIFNTFIIKNFLTKINSDIIKININKIYSIFIKLGNLKSKHKFIYDLLLYIIDFYLLLDNTDYLNYIKFNDTIKFDINIYTNIINKLNKINNHNSIEKFTKMIDNINSIENNNIYDIDTAIDIPDDFLDPLCNSLIEIPIILPSSKVIMDYNIIKKHLLYHNFDPFNRTELTIELLDEFNNKDENIKKNSLLKQKISDWKSI